MHRRRGISPPTWGFRCRTPCRNRSLFSSFVYHLSIDIADVDIGRNIGAHLQIQQAEADKQIAQAKAEHLEKIIDDLLDEAEWCSGDPLCMTSTGINGQGLYGLNYAACHQCTLLPETSCTMRNLLLDRAALIGRIEDGTVGFFEAI